jgi:hypothetical protein
MFCANCGKAVAEGLAFCTNCGAPAPKDDSPAVAEPTPVEAAAAVAAEATTEVAPVVAPAAPELVPAPAALAPTEVQPVVSAGVAGAPQQVLPVAPAPPQHQFAGPNKPNRTGVIVGSIVAAVVVLAGVGVGLYFGLKSDSSVATTTTITVPGDDATIETIPGLDGSTDGTADGGILAGDYMTLVQNIVMEMDYDNGRIPELADIINSTTPDVPSDVYDELSGMLDTLTTTGTALYGAAVPPAFEEAQGYLIDALYHMSARIEATMEGIQAGWDSGTTSAALHFYADGRDERDGYMAAIEDFYASAPEGALLGD